MKIDVTTWRLLELLREANSEEPIYDPDQLGAHGIAEAELKHYEWQRRVNALRLMIGVRLTNEALEQIP